MYLKGKITYQIAIAVGACIGFASGIVFTVLVFVAGRVS